jgi:molybdopterin-guanine dinucleotide biosynthesis protein A
MLEMDIHKVGYLLKKMDTTFIEFHNEDEFLNLNNKEEYYKAKSIIS